MRTPEVEGKLWRLSMRVIRIKVRRLSVAKYDILGIAPYVRALCVKDPTESMFRASKCMWAEAANGGSIWMLQTPHEEYIGLWQRTVDWHEQEGQNLPAWVDRDLGLPRTSLPDRAAMEEWRPK
jgi:hypothetical protein